MQFCLSDVRRSGRARRWAGERRGYGLEVVDRVLAECSPHQPVVDFIGGEPLLYPNLIEAVKLAARRHVLAAVTTNGLKLSSHAEWLVREQLPVLQVSLDGWDQPSQTARGGVKGSFQLLCQGVRAVIEARGARPFPIIRILTTITRINYAHLDRIQRVVAALGVRYWGISNYFYLNQHAHAKHQIFALLHGLTGHIVAHSIPESVYLTEDQVRELKSSLRRVKLSNRRSRMRLAYAWNIDLEKYYSTSEASRSCLCDLPYTRLDIQTDGRMAVCVSGKEVGQIGRDSIADVWRGRSVANYRALYERARPMPMCFRCCGLSQTIRFDPHA